MAAGTQRFLLLQLDEGAWLPLAGVRDALLAANELLGEHAYDVVTLSSPDALLEADAYTALLLASERLPQARESPPHALLAQVTAIATANGVIGGVGTGAAWLAHLGLLDGYRCTINAAFAGAVTAAHPACTLTRKVYEIDRGRMTCAGGTASLDMTIAWLGQRHGERLVQQLAGWFGLERLRTSDDCQPASTFMPATSSKLAEAVALMQANLHEPLSTQHVSELVGVSRRQLERLFRQHMDTLPARWYLEQRLARAQKLLQQSSQSILQVGLGCGFSSGAHFSNAYRAYFGRTPRDERSPRAAAWRAGASTEPSAKAASLSEGTS